jgi:hypothetical protein
MAYFFFKKKKNVAGCRWLTPIILAIQEAEIRRTEVQNQPQQIVQLKNMQHKTEVVEYSSGQVVEFLPPNHEALSSNHQYCQKKKLCFVFLQEMRTISRKHLNFIQTYEET